MESPLLYANSGVFISSVDEMPQDDPGSPQIEFIDFEHRPGPSGSQLREPMVPTDQSDYTASQALRESAERRVQSQQYQPASSQARRISKQSVPRRRRRRRQEVTELEDPSLRRATERLEALEHASAQATREDAQATNSRSARGLREQAERSL
ncbi:uncharacterized protein LOC114362134 [Ostrinia furnacalis]|uniref:uncharacterized protein LOC114362134 n=1 Tax=Ostrinia furnacalis TaxID=93504 RepID=UPI00103DBB2E|nr:uncharacterized protein LOC114362134 [Ostrinia furnacalis]